MYFIYHICFAGLLFLIQINLLYRLTKKQHNQNQVTAVTPSNIQKVASQSKTLHSTHRSSKNSNLSDEHQATVLQNTQRLHRTLSKKGTFTIESVQNGEARNSLPQNLPTTSPAQPERRNSHKTPTIVRKNSGYSVIKTIHRQNSHHHLTNVLPSIPSMQELPDSVRASDVKFIGEIKSDTPDENSTFETDQYLYIVFKIINRLAISQGLIGCLLLINLHFAVAGLIDLIAVWIFRFLQFHRKWIQVFQLFICFGFDLAVLLLLTMDILWTITLGVLIGIDVTLEIIIKCTQKAKVLETIQTQV